MPRMGIESEFANARLGDTRLSERLPRLAEKLSAKPDVGFPRALDAAELEAFYRFIGNDAVSPSAILAPHLEATVRRCVDAKLALVAHDTSEFGYSTSREGMGRVTDEGVGFFAHFSLAIAANGHRAPLGVLSLRTHTRKGKPKRKSGRHTERRPAVERESYRWQEAVDAAEDAVAGQVPLVHLMDREADSYSLFAHMVGRGARFVVRIRSNRKLDETEKLFEHMGEMKDVISREVPISARSKQSSGGSRKVHPLRAARVRVVHVREKNPPEGCEPIDWKLITTEPIDEIADIEAIVDFYKARWLIEEFFKALKSGCAMEKRQLESLDAMLNALAIFTPIAVDLLKLRYLSRHAPDVPADQILTSLQLRILAKKVRLTLPASALEAALAVARLGGHLKRNGPPGWMVLGRGYTDLLTLEEGARIALNL